ncbi:Inorganic pyrophosphatase [Pleurostoma richardsiae]|uniref:Inorganic pyrophosphatase n=1 Tax=Pleurostoma richardsiae TaxID=41990 RepID=A0AA38RL58_9PEZI|nr:Inorganic pyrophosphatase [Pleurostoma richardsiae]
MSSASSRSWKPNRASVNRLQDEARRRSRAGSRAFQTVVTFEDAYSFALRVAYLHYLLQPKKKRKEYITTPKPVHRTHTSNVTDLMKEFMPTGSSTSSLKLPHSFRAALEKRMQGVLQGIEKQPGFNDAAVKRSFGEAYIAFTDANFRKSIDKDRKLEPLVLIFYSSATKVQRQFHTGQEDITWKILVDRHLALFVRLIANVLKDHGGDRDKPELMSRLHTLEQKLLRNDQDLFIDTGQDAEHKTIEVEVPLTYDVKDMPMVQIVAKIFGRVHSQVQADIDANRNVWTEEAALKDLKAYQHRLDSNMLGALRRQDFDLDDAFEEWRRGERGHLSSMMLDILTARPELSKTSTGSYEKPLPVRPQSTYGEDQAYSDLARMISNPDSGSLGFDPSLSLSSLSIEDASSIRSGDDASYTYIPPDPRAHYKVILQHAMQFDLVHADPSIPYTPLSRQSMELLTELCVRWRIPQFTRHVTLLEVATRKFMDEEISVEDVNAVFEFVKEPPPEHRKPPYIQSHHAALHEIDTSKWTIQDFAVFQHTLNSLNDALLRDLYDLLQHCYEPKPPSVGAVMYVLTNHIYNDPSFSRKPEDAAEFSKLLSEGLRQQAANVYRGYLDAEIPISQEDWDFSHVVGLGKKVTGLSQKIKNRYRKNPEILGVSPFTVLVETIFPNFEKDANVIIERIITVAKDRGVEIDLQDGFDLYKELVDIRKIHVESLPGVPFAFSIESLLAEFVWRWINNAETRMEEFVEQAIKQDQFQVRTQNPDGIPSDAERHSVSVVDVFQLFNQTVDQVFQLEWDDDVHHAKFMTALAKAFASGIGRYCEIVEQRFNREMDRQTAQELAAAQKTAQERIMQMAKDAWNTKDRIEPFQFYPESFVKLNNIEYAMQALDKLEKLMNVEQCAEVLRRAEGPKEQIRRPSTYVFTVKIVEAEDLKACDPNGYSDPYVVLCDEYQKRLAKTRVIPRNLNPSWDEAVDIRVTGPLNLIATIWDYDTFGDHDFVGRTSLKLDPVHFSDYLPREFWLDLDTQGRLLLRVSMEGEKDDIQFHFGKAFRHLKRTERNMVRKITDKLTAHINASLSHDALKALLSRGIAASITGMWKNRKSVAPQLTQADVENALQSLFTYFDENFAIMKQTLTDATMLAVMTRLWKEVLIAIEKLLVPPLSDKPSSQKPLTEAELDVVYKWLQLLFEFFNAKDENGEVLGVPAEVLKSPKWHELASLNFFYFDTTENLIRTSERMVAATQQRAQQQFQQAAAGGQAFQHNRLSAPPTFGPTFSGAAAFGSMGTIRRGKSIMMNRNLVAMRQAKEERRREAQADPSDDMILRILRMRPEAVGYLKERHRQKERMAASQAAAMIVRQSIHQGWNTAGQLGRNSLPRR